MQEDFNCKIQVGIVLTFYSSVHSPSHLGQPQPHDNIFRYCLVAKGTLPATWANHNLMIIFSVTWAKHKNTELYKRMEFSLQIIKFFFMELYAQEDFCNEIQGFCRNCFHFLQLCTQDDDLATSDLGLRKLFGLGKKKKKD